MCCWNDQALRTSLSSKNSRWEVESEKAEDTIQNKQLKKFIVLLCWLCLSDKLVVPRSITSFNGTAKLCRINEAGNRGAGAGVRLMVRGAVPDGDAPQTWCGEDLKDRNIPLLESAGKVAENKCRKRHEFGQCHLFIITGLAQIRCRGYSEMVEQDWFMDDQWNETKFKAYSNQRNCNSDTTKGNLRRRLQDEIWGSIKKSEK
jgi:hypothetical protein